MFPSEYEVQAHRRELMLQAEKHRRARQLTTTVSSSQRVGQLLLKLGARFAAPDTDKCVALETHEQVITVCSAATCTA